MTGICDKSIHGHASLRPNVGTLLLNDSRTDCSRNLLNTTCKNRRETRRDVSLTERPVVYIENPANRHQSARLVLPHPVFSLHPAVASCPVTISFRSTTDNVNGQV